MRWGIKEITPLSEEDLMVLEPLDQDELLPQSKQRTEEQQLVLTGEFNKEDGIRELVLYISLLLRTPELMPNLEYPIEELPSWGHMMYLRNNIHRTLDPIMPNILRMYNYITESNYVTDTLLPVVCGACFTYFGMVESGLVRPHCNRCMYKDEEEKKKIRSFWNRQRILQMLGNNRFIMDQIEGQLIYKYYSPNGDKTWQLIIPKTLD